MKKILLPLSLAAVATLAACGGMREVRTQAVPPSSAMVAPSGTIVATNPMTTPVVYVTGAAPRAGWGKVTFVADPMGPVGKSDMQRLTVRMDDGSTQMIDKRGPQISIGERVQIASDNTIRWDALASRQ